MRRPAASPRLALPRQRLWFQRLWFRRLRPSLAVKSIALLGAGVAAVVLLGLSLPWLRMNTLVTEAQLGTSRELLAAWPRVAADVPPGQTVRVGEAEVLALTLTQARAASASDPLMARALAAFEKGREELLGRSWEGQMARRYRYLRARRDEQQALIGIYQVERVSRDAALQLAVNTLFAFTAGVFVLAVALVVFFQIAERLVLSPVRALRAAADSVRSGQLSVRARLRTGDEFQELADTFNLMVASLARNQQALQRANAALNSRVGELARANLSLHENARLKGQFLANVSHELRTPLNTIIGFAELLREMTEGSPPAPDAPTQAHDLHRKRLRYQTNIVTAARALLELVESLLEMARIEAGKVELRPTDVDLRELCEGLVGMLEGIARGKGIIIRLELPDRLPRLRTDGRKVQQILFNFLSNAVKFTDVNLRRDGQPGLIIVRAEVLGPRDPQSNPDGHALRVGVLDNGPGIPKPDQAKVFEAFRQLDGSHTRRAAGTGLGLAICKELATILGGRIELVSEPGVGSAFSLLLPAALDEHRAKEAAMEARFRSALAAERTWAGEPTDPDR